MKCRAVAVSLAVSHSVPAALASISARLPAVLPTSVLPPVSTLSTGLDALFKSNGKLFWGAFTDVAEFPDPTELPVLLGNFGSITPETSLSWRAVSSP